MNPTSPTRRLVQHSASYLVGQGLFFLGRLVFYCAFTRLFAPDDYGSLNLITSGLLFLIVGVRLGQNDSIVRFLPEGERRGQARQYVASVILPMFAIGAVSVAVLVGIVYVTAARLGLSDDLRWALYFTAPIVGLRMASDLTYATLRAQERPGAAVALDAARNWAAILGSLGLVFAWRASMAPFFLGQMGGEIIIFVACLWFLSRHFSLHPSRIDKAIWRQTFDYGWPMALYHLAAVALLYIDRPLIRIFCDLRAVGEYSAGYNLAAMVQQFITLPIALAVVPLYMNLWSRGEHEAARQFVQTTQRWFWLGVWPCLFGTIAVKSDLILLLATEKYAASSAVIGYVLLGCVFYGGYAIYAAGLLIHRKTGLMSLWMLAALAVNVGANVVLIPRLNIKGAAIATTISYIFLALCLARASNRYLAIRFWPRQATIYLIGAVVMFGVVESISLATPWASLAVRTAVGTIVYGAWVLIADGELRRRVLAMMKRSTQVFPE